MEITELSEVCVLQFHPHHLLVQPLKAILNLRDEVSRSWPMACTFHNYSWRGVNKCLFTPREQTDRQTKDIILPRPSLVK